MGILHQILKSGNELAARVPPVSDLLANRFHREAVAPGRNYSQRRQWQHRFFVHRTRPPYRVRLVDGFDMELTADDVIQRRIMLYGPIQKHVWEPKTAELVQGLAGRGGNFLVAGGHVGYFPLLMAMHAPAGSAVFTFEPNDGQRKLLQRNVALNHPPASIHVEAEALFDESGKTLHFSDNTVHSSLLNAGDSDQSPGQTVHTITINDYFAAKNISRLSLIFLDIEGGEPQAIAGASHFLAQSAQEAPDLLFELVPGRLEASTCQRMLDRLKQSGYSLYLIDDPYDYYVATDARQAPLRLFELPGCSVSEIAAGQAALNLKDPNLFATKRGPGWAGQFAQLRSLTDFAASE